MLRSVEINAEVTSSAQGNLLHNLHWQKKFELDLDCYVCELTDRTTAFEWGKATAICVGGREGEGARHRTSARIESMECGAKAERQVLRALVESWWTPFQKNGSDEEAQPLGPDTQVHLALAYFCRREHRSGSALVHTGMTTPMTFRCPHCDMVMATCDAPPSIRVLD